MTAEQLEASRAERMRQNGHGAVTIEDIRTWIEETGLCIFLPRSAQAGFTAPTFVEAIAGQRTTEPNLELISTAESLLVRLEAEGVAVRLSLSGQPGDQPDYVVAGWVLPYIYALRGDRDWRRQPQLTGSRQVSPLAVQAAKQIDTGNQNAMQIRDALGREVTESAVLRALHELWKQLRIIPVVSEVGQPALWQPLRQRFQKAIAEGASTSQVTAISVLASIYLQAVVAASMEDVEMFLSPLTSRSKIREVVRGLAATRQVHTTNMGSSPLFYVAGTLPEFPVAPSFQISAAYPPYRGSSYMGLDRDLHTEDEPFESHRGTLHEVAASAAATVPAAKVDKTAKIADATAASPDAHVDAHKDFDEIDLPSGDLDVAVTAPEPLTARQKPLVDRAHRSKRPVVATAPVATSASKTPAAPRPRALRNTTSGRAATPAPRDRSRNASASGDSRTSSNGDRRRAPAPRGTASNSSSSRSGAGARPAGSRPASGPRASSASGSVNRGSASRGSNDSFAKGKTNGFAHNNGAKANGASAGQNGNGHNGNGRDGIKGHAANGHATGSASNGRANSTPGKANVRSNGNGYGSRATTAAKPNDRPAARESKPGSGSSNHSNHNASRTQSTFKGSPSKPSNGSRPNGTGSNGTASRSTRNAPAANASAPRSSHAPSKKDDREPVKASAAKRYSFSGQSPKSISKRPTAAASKSNLKSGQKAAATSSTKRRG